MLTCADYYDVIIARQALEAVPRAGEVATSTVERPETATLADCDCIRFRIGHEPIAHHQISSNGSAGPREPLSPIVHRDGATTSVRAMLNR